MDSVRFDRLAKTLSRSRTRRGALASLLTGTVASVLARRVGLNGSGVGEAVAKKKTAAKKQVTRTRSGTSSPPQSCVLQPYTANTLAERGLDPAAAANINWSKVIAERTLQDPHRDRVHLEFFPVLAAISACAVQHNVTVRVNSAYRNTKRNLATGSVSGDSGPHIAGHAVDWFVQHGGGMCAWDIPSHSGCLGTDPPTTADPPTPKDRAYTVDPLHWSDGAGGHGVEVADVRAFIDCVRDTDSPLGGGQKIRWGGQFMPAFKKKTGKPVCNGKPPCQGPDAKSKQQGFDPIHFDSGVSLPRWKAVYATWKKQATEADEFLRKDAAKRGLANMRDCPEGEVCNLKTGLCECDAGTSCEDGKELDPETCECVCVPISCPDGEEQDPDSCQCEEAVCRAAIATKRGAVDVAGVRCGQHCCGPCETCKTSKKGKRCVETSCFPGECNPETGACEECCPPAKREACDLPVDDCMFEVDDDYCDCLSDCEHRDTDNCCDRTCIQACDAAWGDGWDACLDAHDCVSDQCGNCSGIRFRPFCVFQCDGGVCGEASTDHEPRSRADRKHLRR
jgi:hypothetical protein